eukprot:659246-Pleurochrysis_carterae.AAC.1
MGLHGTGCAQTVAEQNCGSGMATATHLAVKGKSACAKRCRCVHARAGRGMAEEKTLDAAARSQVKHAADSWALASLVLGGLQSGADGFKVGRVGRFLHHELVHHLSLQEPYRCVRIPRKGRQTAAARCAHADAEDYGAHAAHSPRSASARWGAMSSRKRLACVTLVAKGRTRARTGSVARAMSLLRGYTCKLCGTRQHAKNHSLAPEQSPAGPDARMCVIACSNKREGTNRRNKSMHDCAACAKGLRAAQSPRTPSHRAYARARARASE